MTALRYIDTTLSRYECLLSIGSTNWREAGAVATLSYAFGDEQISAPPQAAVATVNHKPLPFSPMPKRWHKLA